MLVVSSEMLPPAPVGGVEPQACVGLAPEGSRTCLGPSSHTFHPVHDPRDVVGKVGFCIRVSGVDGHLGGEARRRPRPPVAGPHHVHDPSKRVALVEVAAPPE